MTFPPPPPCRVCGSQIAHISLEACPLVKAVTYDSHGNVKSVEKFPPNAFQRSTQTYATSGNASGVTNITNYGAAE